MWHAAAPTVDDPTDHRPFVELLTGDPEMIRTEFDALMLDASPEFTFPWVADLSATSARRWWPRPFNGRGHRRLRQSGPQECWLLNNPGDLGRPIHEAEIDRFSTVPGCHPGYADAGNKPRST